MTDDYGNRIELGEEKCAGWQDGSGRVPNRDGARVNRRLSAPEQGAINAPMVWGVVVYEPIAVLSKRGLGEQAAQAGGVLHLAEPD